MNNGLLGTEVRGHPAPEIIHAAADTELTVFGLQHEIGGKYAGLTFIHLVLIIGKGAVEGLSRAYFRNHRFSKLLESSIILRLNSINSSVDFSNL